MSAARRVEYVEYLVHKDARPQFGAVHHDHFAARLFPRRRQAQRSGNIQQGNEIAAQVHLADDMRRAAGNRRHAAQIGELPDRLQVNAEELLAQTHHGQGQQSVLLLAFR